MTVVFPKIKQVATRQDLRNKLLSEVSELFDAIDNEPEDRQLDELLDVIMSALSLGTLITNYDFAKLEVASILHYEKLRARNHKIIGQFRLEEVSDDEKFRSNSFTEQSAK